MRQFHLPHRADQNLAEMPDTGIGSVAQLLLKRPQLLHRRLETELVWHTPEVGLAASLVHDLNPSVKEAPKGKDRVGTRLRPDAATSSGSAVIAEEGKTSTLAVEQRKLAGFDMEVYSVYEAARYAKTKPVFFAAKTVVDDGGKNKGDQFHRVGCLISARFVAKAIRAGIVDVKLSSQD